MIIDMIKAYKAVNRLDREACNEHRKIRLIIKNSEAALHYINSLDNQFCKSRGWGVKPLKRKYSKLDEKDKKTISDIFNEYRRLAIIYEDLMYKR